METLKAEIRSMVARVGDLKEAEIGDDTDLANDLRMDSLQALELLAELENHFQIEISEEQLRRFTSVNNIVGLVEELCGQNAASMVQ